jgi:transposase
MMWWTALAYGMRCARVVALINNQAREPSTMKKVSIFGECRSIGIDIAKNSFSVHGLDGEGRTVFTKELKRSQVLTFFAKLPPTRIGLEACGSSNHWGRELVKLGHDVKLIPAQRVKAFLPRMKNDAQDAKAIARAVNDPEMRFVGVRSVAQQTILMLFKVRDLLMRQHTQTLNALRGHFAEIGIVVPQGAHEVKLLMARVMAGETQAGAEPLPGVMRQAMTPLVHVIIGLEDEIKVLNVAISKQHKASETSMRLATVPGIGTLIASLLTATFATPKQFASGREFAASLGLVPRQHSTGGKPKLGRISKMGNRDLRSLLVVGAHAALFRIKTGKTKSHLADWARALLVKKSFRLVAVALANKMARIAWTIMTGDDCYNPQHSRSTAAPHQRPQPSA